MIGRLRIFVVVSAVFTCLNSETIAFSRNRTLHIGGASGVSKEESLRTRPAVSFLGESKSKRFCLENFLAETVNLIDQGAYQAALKKFIWYSEVAAKSKKKLKWVKHSEILSVLARLVHNYIPAQNWVTRLRDQQHSLLLQGQGEKADFADLLSFNSLLREPENSVKLFEELDKGNPQLAKQCWSLISESLVKKLHCAVLQKYLISPKKEFRKVLKVYKEFCELAEDDSEEMKGYADQFLVQRACELIEAFGKIGRCRAAKRVYELAQAVVPSHDYCCSLSKYLLTSSKPEAQQKNKIANVKK